MLVGLKRRFNSLQICISWRKTNSDDFKVKNRRQGWVNLEGHECWKFGDLFASFTFPL